MSMSSNIFTGGTVGSGLSGGAKFGLAGGIAGALYTGKLGIDSYLGAKHWGRGRL